MKFLPLVLANLKRHKLRTILTTASVALALFLFASLRTVVTTVRNDANRKSASATLHIVSTVRSLCRRRLARTSGRYFIAAPPAPPWW